MVLFANLILINCLTPYISLDNHHHFTSLGTVDVSATKKLRKKKQPEDFAMDQNRLIQLLLTTLSPNGDDVKRAENEIKLLKPTPGFATTLLQVCSRATTTSDKNTISASMAAAICFKNFVKQNWDTNQESEQLAPEVQISEQDRQNIKNGIVDFMCTVHPNVQKQLGEAVRVIATKDWPSQWEGLVPSLTRRLDPYQPMDTIIGVLSTMNELFKRFRDAAASDELHLELKQALEESQEPISVFFYSSISARALESRENEQLYSAVRLCCRIFYSLNWQTIPEYFEDHQKEWMGEFLKYFQINFDPFPNYLNDENSGPLERVQAAIFENIRLYSEKYAEEFDPYLQSFVQASFGLLVSASTSPKARYDELVISGMRFLSTIVSSISNKHMFENEQGMKAILEQVVIPNLAIRSNDIESFEDNPIEYLRRDIEGSDAETRRRIACDMIEKLCRNFDQAITALCFGYIQQLLARYAANKKDWASKDAAITLVIAVSVIASTSKDGATKIKNEQIVLGFLNSDILAELTSATATGSHAILKADAIKYISTFRQFIPKQDVLQTILPNLLNALDSKSVVVHTYAAAAIDGILAVREQPAAGMSVRHPRYQRENIAQFVQPILVRLFTLIEASQQNYNEFLMKCVVRVIIVAREDVGPVVPSVLQKLSDVLSRVAANPSNPIFNHFMFESIAALLKFGFESKKCTVEQLEAAVNPTFEKILTSYIVEFVPYVLQIMAQTLQMRDSNVIPPHFLAIFPAIMSSTLWETRANIPALVTLLEAYLVRGNQLFAVEGKITQLFQVFEKLLLPKSTEDLSFELVQCIVVYCPFNQVQPFLPAVFRNVLMKYSNTKLRSVALAKSLVIFVCVLIGKHGVQAAFQPIESLTPNMFNRFLEEIFIPNLGKVSGVTQKKICAIGVTRLLCEYSQSPVWNRTLAASVQFIADRTHHSTFLEDQTSETNDSLEKMAEAGHNTGFARLAFAQDSANRDFFPEITDPVSFFLQNLITQNGLANRIYEVLAATDPKLVEVFKLWVSQKM